jgi:hypothetical protein
VEDSIAWVQLLEDTPYEKRLEVQQEGHTLYVGRGYKQFAPEALAEVLGNAVVHRDYDLVGAFRKSVVGAAFPAWHAVGHTGSTWRCRLGPNRQYLHSAAP